MLVASESSFTHMTKVRLVSNYQLFIWTLQNSIDKITIIHMWDIGFGFLFFSFLQLLDYWIWLSSASKFAYSLIIYRVLLTKILYIINKIIR